MNHSKHTLFHQFTLLLVVICSIVAVSFCAMFFYIDRYSLQASSEITSNLHDQTLLRIEAYYKEIENQAYTICYSPTLQEYIQTDNIQSRISSFSKIRSVHSGIYLSLNGLMGIAAYDTNGCYLNSSMENLFPVESLPEQWANINNYTYTGFFEAGSSFCASRDCFAFLSPVYELLPYSRLLGKRIGTIVLTFNTDHLNSIVKSNASIHSHLILTDADGQLICASSNEAVSYYTKKGWTTKSPAFQLESILSKSNWHLYSFMPHGFLQKGIQPLIIIVICTGCIFIFLLIMLLYMLRKKVLLPIVKISTFMENVPYSKEPSHFENTEDNELGTMISVMNQMLKEIEQKNDSLRASEAKLYAAELLRKDMAIIAYRNQINPHFLYNTLDCICSMAMYHDADDIAQISESLSTMFRYAVKGDSFSTIQQEINYVQEYASIIRHRFMNRICIHINASPETLPLQTIKLLIQPLVENAVFHGVEHQVGSGNVYVKVSIQGGTDLVISVYDDGIGISEEKLQELNNGIADSQSDCLTVPSTEKSIGLYNIARRIHLYYDGKGIIRINSTSGSGTVVTIILPLLKGGSLCTK